MALDSNHDEKRVPGHVEHGGSPLIAAPDDQIAMPEGAVLTTTDAVVNWCRKYSLWPMPFATACCGIELMAVARADSTSLVSARR